MDVCLLCVSAYTYTYGEKEYFCIFVSPNVSMYFEVFVSVSNVFLYVSNVLVRISKYIEIHEKYLEIHRNSETPFSLLLTSIPKIEV